MRLHGERILVVEDEILTATYLAEIVEEAGAITVGPAESTMRALELIEQEPVTAAILDVNLRDGEVTPVAMRLASLRIPFVLHTGCPLPMRLRTQFGAAPVLTKPCRASKVVDTLMDLLDLRQIESGAAAVAGPSPLGHVLLIEDEPNTAIILEAHMRALGFASCEQADTEARAIQAARWQKPDLMVVDIRLREGNGIAAAAAINAHCAVPMIVVTAHPPEAAGIETALVVRKPFSAAALGAAVAHARLGYGA